MIIALPLDDDPYPEHVTLWRREDVERFLDRWNCAYDVVHCDRGLQGKDGRRLIEGIFITRFPGGGSGLGVPGDECSWN